MKTNSRGFFAILALVGSSVSMLANADCVHERNFAAGKVRLGDSVDLVVKLPHDESCVVGSDYVDCEFQDKDGISYLVDGHQVTRIEASGNTSAILPFGVRIGEPIDSFLQRISDVDDSPQLRMNWNEEHVLVVSIPASCDEGEQASSQWIYLIFDKELKVQKVGLREAGD